MHELTIITNIFNIIEEIAEENQLTKITKVTIKIGKLRHVYPEMLQNAFEIVSKDTKAENADLHIKSIRTRVRCKNCGHLFFVNNNYCCRKCGDYSLEVLEGDEIIIETLEGDR